MSEYSTNTSHLLLFNIAIAPTDNAFDDLPEGTVEYLLQPENSEQLVDLLKYHVVAANAASDSLSSGEIETLNGDSVMVDVSEEGVMVDEAKVIVPDIIASNGIIHAIDKVLMPPKDPTMSPTTSLAPTSASKDSIYDIAAGAEDFSTLGKLLIHIIYDSLQIRHIMFTWS